MSVCDDCRTCCGIPEPSQEEIAAAIRDWIEKRHCRPGGVSPELRSALEEMASDIEAGAA